MSAEYGRGSGRRQTSRKRRKKKSGFRKWTLIPIVLAILVIAVFAAYKIMVRPPDVNGGISVLEEDGAKADPARVQTGGRKQDVYTFLLCGTDDGNGGTDTIMVAAYDAKNQKMNVMSIPRDTMVNVSWSTKKINSTYNAGGIQRLAKEVGNLIGFPVDFYVKVDLAGFVKLIDALGGVEFEVPYNMNYEDPTQNLSIHVKKGMQHLDGETAVGVVRWRKNNDGTGYSSGDIGRIQTQQAFLAAVGEKCLNLGNITKVKEFAKIFADYVETDLSVGNLIWLAQQAMHMNMEQVHFFTMPGDYSASYRGGSYVLPYAGKLAEAVNTYLNPYVTDVLEQDMDIMSITSSGKLVSSKGSLATGEEEKSGKDASSGGSVDLPSDAEESSAAPKETAKNTKEPSAAVTPKATATPKPTKKPQATKKPVPSQSTEPAPTETVIPIETQKPTHTPEPTPDVPVPTGIIGEPEE
jgi:LCP family protein required for cell wall assembly